MTPFKLFNPPLVHWPPFSSRVPTLFPVEVSKKLCKDFSKIFFKYSVFTDNLNFLIVVTTQRSHDVHEMYYWFFWYDLPATPVILQFSQLQQRISDRRFLELVWERIILGRSHTFRRSPSRSAADSRRDRTSVKSNQCDRGCAELVRARLCAAVGARGKCYYGGISKMGGGQLNTGEGKMRVVYLCFSAF